MVEIKTISIQTDKAKPHLLNSLNPNSPLNSLSNKTSNLSNQYLPHRLTSPLLASHLSF